MPFFARTPAAPLDRFIELIWFCNSDPRPLTLERVLPTGAAQLIVNLKEDQTRTHDPECGAITVSAGTILSGVTTRYSIIDSAEQECVAGVAFRPGGIAAFFPMPAHELCDADVPVELLWGRERANELRERLLEAAGPTARLDILERTMAAALRRPVFHPAVGFALDTFTADSGIASIGVVADQAGLSAKRFIERFKTSVGLTPKHFCRILRFQRALARAEQGRVDWTRIAADCGYFDQAHFIRDFRSFAGITPTGYEVGRTEFRNHVKFVQSNAAVEMA